MRPLLLLLLCPACGSVSLGGDAGPDAVLSADLTAAPLAYQEFAAGGVAAFCAFAFRCCTAVERSALQIGKTDADCRVLYRPYGGCDNAAQVSYDPVAARACLGEIEAANCQGGLAAILGAPACARVFTPRLAPGAWCGTCAPGMQGCAGGYCDGLGTNRCFAWVPLGGSCDGQARCDPATSWARVDAKGCTCAPLEPDGTACGTAWECTSGGCVDGGCGAPPPSAACTGM
jgi:hypothetical protein